MTEHVERRLTNKVEYQILLNQYIIMAFLHGTHLAKLSFMNEGTFESLRKCIEETKKLLETEITGCEWQEPT